MRPSGHLLLPSPSGISGSATDDLIIILWFSVYDLLEYYFNIVTIIW